MKSGKQNRRWFLRNLGTATAGMAVLGSIPWAEKIFSQSQPPTLKIGLIDDFTGQGQRGALLSQQGAQLAVDAVNQVGGAGGCYLFELVKADTKTSSTGAVDAANQLINRGDISYVVGPQRTNELLPIQPLFAAAAIPHIMLASTDHTLTDRHSQAPLSLRYSMQDIMQMAPVAKYAVTVSGHKSFFGIAVDNGDGRNAIAAFQQVLEKLGGSLIQSEFYPFGSTDFSTLVAKFKASGADALISSDGLPTSVIALLKEFQLQGLPNDRFYGSIVYDGPTFFSQVGSKGQADGIIFPWFYDDGVAPRAFTGGPPPSHEALVMDQAFVAKTGATAGPTATVQAWAWGAIKLIQQAIEGLIAEQGADTVAKLNPVNELPRATVEQYILKGATGTETGPTFQLTFGDQIGFYACGQADVRCGPATYSGGLLLLQDKDWADDLITGFCS
jgi:ABC-type branched-subunit amino acid transport system substrate-binding protein